MALRRRGEIEIAVANLKRDYAIDRANLVIEIRQKMAEAVAWFKRGGTELQ
jgi:hypothetical protein